MFNVTKAIEKLEKLDRVTTEVCVYYPVLREILLAGQTDDGCGWMTAKELKEDLEQRIAMLEARFPDGGLSWANGKPSECKCLHATCQDIECVCNKLDTISIPRSVAEEWIKEDSQECYINMYDAIKQALKQ